MITNSDLASNTGVNSTDYLWQPSVSTYRAVLLRGTYLPIRLSIKFYRDGRVEASVIEMLYSAGQLATPYLVSTGGSKDEVSSGILGKAAAPVDVFGLSIARFAAVLKDEGINPEASGYSYFVTGSTAGVMTSVSRVGDGSDASIVVTSASYLHADGTVALYSSLGVPTATYPVKNFFAGNLQFAWCGAEGNAVSISGGEFEWKRAAANGVSLLTRKVSFIGSIFDTTKTASSVYGSLTNLQLGGYANGTSVDPAGSPLYGINNISITNTWGLNNTTRIPFGTGYNFTGLTMGGGGSSPILTMTVYDPAMPKSFVSQGVILQTPPAASGVRSGAYGLIPTQAPTVGGVVQPTIYKEWHLRE